MTEESPKIVLECASIVLRPECICVLRLGILPIRPMNQQCLHQYDIVFRQDLIARLLTKLADEVEQCDCPT